MKRPHCRLAQRGMVTAKPNAAVVAFERTFGESGRGNGQFRLPRHICSLPDNNLCVSDTVNQRLQILTPDGEWCQNIGEPGSANGQLRGPCGVACEGGMLFVVEGGNHRVQKLALADGSPLGKAGSHGSKKNGELWCPHGVTISKGQAFVADYINGRIVVYDISNMEHVRTFGSRGSKEGELEYPCGIAVKGEEVYVAEFGNHRISVFTKRGNFERILGGEGKAPGQFYQPRGLLFVKGWLLVTEPKRVTVRLRLCASACAAAPVHPRLCGYVSAAAPRSARSWCAHTHAHRRVHDVAVRGQPFTPADLPTQAVPYCCAACAMPWRSLCRGGSAATPPSRARRLATPLLRAHRAAFPPRPLGRSCHHQTGKCSSAWNCPGQANCGARARTSSEPT